MSRYLIVRPFRTHRMLQAGDLLGKGVKIPATSLRAILNLGYMKEITEAEAQGIIRSKAEARSQSRVGKEPVKPSAVVPMHARESEQDKVSTGDSVRPAARKEGI